MSLVLGHLTRYELMRRSVRVRRKWPRLHHAAAQDDDFAGFGVGFPEAARVGAGGRQARPSREQGEQAADSGQRTGRRVRAAG